jgi:hypothetical protein
MSGLQVRDGIAWGLAQKIPPEERNFPIWAFSIARKPGTIWRKRISFSPPPQAMATVCRHPRVRIVSRHEDTEFVECLDCGEVFDSEEFRDMEIEANAEAQTSMEDA